MVINIDEIEINLIDEIEDVKKVIKLLDELETINNKYINYASIFEFENWEANIGHLNCGIEIDSYKEQFCVYLTSLREHLEKIYNYDMGKNKDITQIQNILKNYAQFKCNSVITKKQISQLIEIIDESFLESDYAQCLNHLFTRELDSKIKKIIVDDQLSNLDYEKQTIQSVKVSFIGRFTGKKKLKELVLENIDLKRQSVIAQVNCYSGFSNLSDIIDNVKQYIENKNVNNENIAMLNQILDNIAKTNLQNLIPDDQEIEKKQNKQKVFTLVKYNDNSISTKQKIEYFTNSNIELKKDNTKSRMKSITEQTKNSIVDFKSPINQFFNCINNI